jgi:hypothetical protein
LISLGIFFEEYFGRIFLGEIFGRKFLVGIFGRNSLGGIIREEFFVYIVKVRIWKELICLSRFWF